jgi:hypothetical protein
MDRSPKNREIEPVVGTPGDIITRGEQIEALGKKMLDSADVLETIKNDSVGDGSQQGRAIESLKDSIGDSYKTLREAGELYEPVGPVITAYGEALEDCKPKINNAVDDCETKWAIYESLPGDKDGSTTPEAGGGILGIGGHDADSPEAKEEAENNKAKALAYQDWEDAADAFDGGYDSWEKAYNTAVDDIGDEMAGSIKDSFWSTLTDFLEIAALVVGIAALIIGGPLLAVLALAVGALLLFTTFMSYKNGERSKTDIAFAALGVIPFGKVTTATKLANLGSASTKTVLKSASGISALKGAGAQLRQVTRGTQYFHKSGLAGVFRNRGTAAGFKQLLTGSPNGYKTFLRGQRQLYQGPGALLAAARNNSPALNNLARIDQIATLVSTTGRNLGLADKGAGVFGGDVPTMPKPIEFAF